MSSSNEGPKGTIFSGKTTLNCGGRLLDISSPLVMGILNITPDSFYDGGQFNSDKSLLSRVEEMLTEGAAIIDVGGYSSRPGASQVSETDELDRVLPVIRLIMKTFPDAIVSIDTFRAQVGRAAAREGATMINDIAAGELDNAMFSTVAELGLPYIMMHMQGTPENMQNDPQYENLMGTLHQYFSSKINQLRSMGVNDIIIDPGFGFGKSVEHNYHILKHLKELEIYECPLLVGLSRKSMINKVLKTAPKDALPGTITTNTIALLNGARLLRVHDVKAATDAIKIVKYYQNL